ncbi:MAG: TRAP transporter large permease [Desulfocucumaceae bacterium]
MSLMAGLVGAIVFVILLLLRIPLGIAMAMVGFVGYSYLVSPEAALNVLANGFYSTFSSYSLSVMPMFVWMGLIAFHGGIASRLYDFAFKAVGHLRGGLAMATQVAGAILGAVSGSSTAATATIATIAIKEMRRHGYDPPLAAASAAASGTLDILIPPSVIFVIYAIATEQSIGKLLIAGVLPGLILCVLYMFTIWIIIVRNPALAPPAPRAPIREVFRAMMKGSPEVFIVFCLSLGGLFAGWFTPTEAGAVGVAGVLAVCLIERSITWKAFISSLADATRTTAMIMLAVAGAIIFARFFAITRISFELGEWVSSLPLPPWVIIWIIIGLHLLLGCVLDKIAMILLTIPIFYPVAVDVLGYDPIWFGVIIVMITVIGLLLPPIGLGVYVVKGIARDIPLEDIFRASWPFVIAGLITCAILIAVPEIATLLPNMMR